jgi:uncharacterized membrane protein YfcA
VALAAASLILSLLNGRAPGEILIDEGIAAIVTMAVAFSVVGGLVASHRPENPIAWIFCAAALFQGLSISGYEYATYALITEPGSLPLGALASWLAQWIWAPGLGLILVFLPLLFADGRLPSRRWRQATGRQRPLHRPELHDGDDFPLAPEGSCIGMA